MAGKEAGMLVYRGGALARLGWVEKCVTIFEYHRHYQHEEVCENNVAAGSAHCLGCAALFDLSVEAQTYRDMTSDLFPLAPAGKTPPSFPTCSLMSNVSLPRYLRYQHVSTT
jgi:hypothetical protein